MLRLLLVPLVVIQLFMMYGYVADGSNSSDVSPGWDPNGSDVRLGWDPNGGTSPDGSSPASDIGPGWDPNG